MMYHAGKKGNEREAQGEKKRERCWWRGEVMACGRKGNIRTGNNGIDRAKTIRGCRFHH